MNKQDIAAQARRLRDDETFQSVLEAIRQDQVSVFLNVSASQEARDVAHLKVRALAEIESEIKRRIDDASIEQHRKDRHRAND